MTRLRQIANCLASAEQDMAASLREPGCREPDPQAVPALRASIPSAECFRTAFDELAEAAGDAIYGPMIRDLERKIAERDQATGDVK